MEIINKINHCIAIIVWVTMVDSDSSTTVECDVGGSGVEWSGSKQQSNAVSMASGSSPLTCRQLRMRASRSQLPLRIIVCARRRRDDG